MTTTTPAQTLPTTGHNAQSDSYGPPDYLKPALPHLQRHLAVKILENPKSRPLPTLELETPVGSHAPSIDSSMFRETCHCLTMTSGPRNRAKLNEKARERMSRLRGKALNDPGLAKTQADMRRTHDATYRVKHKKEITFKATLRLQDLHWKKYHGRPPPTEKLDFTEQFSGLRRTVGQSACPPIFVHDAKSVPPPRRNCPPTARKLSPQPSNQSCESTKVAVQLASFSSPSMSTPDYYCYPPVHQSSGWDETISPCVWLVTDPECPSPGPGLYTSWHAVSALTEGRQDPLYFDRQEDSYPEWHVHCRLSEHNHPVDPEPSRARPPFNYEQSPSRTVQSPARNVPHHITPPSAALPNLHFAVRGGEVVYGRLEPALQQYLCVSGTESTTELIATENYYKAIFFARGASEAASEQLAAARTGNGDPFISSSPGTRCGSLTSPISPPPRGTSSPRATTSRTPATPSRTGRSGPKPIPAPVFTAPQQQPAIRPQHRVARRDPNSSRTRMASITAAMEEKDREEKQRRSLASSARRAVIAEALASTPKGQRGAEVGSSSKGKGKEVEEEEGEETDYDLDGEFLEIAKDWVPSEERFDPTTENRPRDDA
ncbi:hypothetical protein C8F04DRAFT_1181461 [Mycena alexandri]|uniref:Uncharacterized protein n=1 Tax=Mycena alexandri TaxID=1745969 RepID=A0AAD6SYK0_9AGAR|nr:hypothetical protein C8F04DRAFT_1181461 [Mycena alexandri]